MRNLFFVALIALLVACAPASTAVSPSSTRTASEIIPVSGIEARNTPSPLPSNSPVPSKTKTTIASRKTPTPSPTLTACLKLLRPANGASLSKSGNVEFAWESQPGGQLYVLSLISGTGLREDSRTTSTKLARSVKATDKSGAYYWSVSAYDADGYLICNSGFITFSKGVSSIDDQTLVGADGSNEQVAVAADSSSTIYTFEDLINQGLIPPPPIPPFTPPLDPVGPVIGITEIVPPEPPAPAPPPTDTEIVPPEPPATPPPDTEVPPPPPASEVPPTDPPPTEAPVVP